MSKEIGIYVHIPFCKSKCHYCNFTSFCNMEEKIEEYINSLCNEIIEKSEILCDREITSIYFGGGTPSYIPSKYIEKILNVIKLYIYDADNKIKNNEIEVTLEINPGTVTIDKIQDYKKMGINRVSVGLQSTHEDILKKIGRVHNLKDFENTLDMLNKCNIDNISVDLIYPLPDLSFAKFKQTLEYIENTYKEKNIKHISIYNIEVHDNTKLKFLLDEGYLKLPNENEEYNMKEYLEEKLKNMSFNKYEISNYSLKNYESKHNMLYWRQEEYLGFGVAAASFINSVRYTNTLDIAKYIDYNRYKYPKEEVEELDEKSLKNEHIILKLRLKDGIDIKEFNLKFKCDIMKEYRDKFDYLKNNKLIEITDTNIFLNKRGQEIANIVWEEFI